MASRTSASVGIMVTLAILSVLALGLFVTSIVFFARVQKLTTDLQLRENDLEAAVRADERDDRWEELKRSTGGKTGVVRFLDRSVQELASLTTGSRRDTPERLLERVGEAAGPERTPLLALLSDKNTEIEQLTSRVKAAEDAATAARADLQASADRVGALQAEHRAAVDRLNQELGAYRAGTDEYRAKVDSTRTDMEDRVSSIRGEADASVATLEARVGQLESELLVASDQLRRLRVERGTDTLRPAPEEALVDGGVVGVNAAARQVYLDLGRRDRLVLGMSFEVYASGSAIKADAQGVYPPGKGSIEIIRVDDTSSVARVTRENAGTPIINGDVIANAVYDPKKIYTFAVFGNFDTGGDGIDTPQEIQDIRAMIEQWNGKVTEEVTGNTDFLVLGSRPVLPPQPKPTDPVELIQRYLQLRQNAQKYDDLFQKARETGIPVLNQNRLMTLTGTRTFR